MIDWARIPLHDREVVYRFLAKHKRVPMLSCPYTVFWEDPSDIDAPMRVSVVSNIWYSMARYGGILPPVEVYWQLAEEEAQPDFEEHKLGYLLHKTPPVPAMSAEEAIEYIIKKDIPFRVWRDYTGNKSILRIVPVKAIPHERRFRDAWQLAQHQGAA